MFVQIVDSEGEEISSGYYQDFDDALKDAKECGGFIGEVKG